MFSGKNPFTRMNGEATEASCLGWVRLLRIGVEPSYLSKVERGETPPPSEEKIRRLATELNDDPDVLLAMAGKVSTDLQDVIRRLGEECGHLFVVMPGGRGEMVAMVQVAAASIHRNGHGRGG